MIQTYFWKFRRLVMICLYFLKSIYQLKISSNVMQTKKCQQHCSVEISGIKYAVVNTTGDLYPCMDLTELNASSFILLMAVEIVLQKRAN